MGNAKVIFGNETLIDLTGDTVSANNLLSGATAHNRSGDQVAGTVYGVPSGGTTGQYLTKHSNTDGDTEWTTLDDMTGATASTPGTHGLVPAPAAGDNTKFLRGDGTWAEAGGGGGGGFDYKDWLIAGGLNPMSYADLAAVLADEKAVRKLMTIHTAVDYLASQDLGADVLTILSDNLCAKWINLRDYALDTLYGNQVFAPTMDQLGKYGYGEWAKLSESPETWGPKGNVPIMTSNTAPYGTASAYQVFDGNASTTASGTDFSYKFVNPICPKDFICKNASGQDITGGTMQASNDGSTWAAPVDGEYYLNLRVHFAASTTVATVQFYGREMKVSVPVMTSNTAPYGVAGCVQTLRSGYSAYQVFDGSDASYILGEESNTHDVYYDFGYPVLVKAMAYLISGYVSAKIQYSDDASTWVDGSEQSTFAQESTQRGFVIGNATTPHRYWRFLGGQSLLGYGGIYTVQFYGLNYSEYDWDTVNPRHYLYDHGVTPNETINYSKHGDNVTVESKTNGEAYVEVPAATQRMGYINAVVNLTNYNLLRWVAGTIFLNGSAVSVTNGNTYDVILNQTPIANAGQYSNTDTPYNKYLDISAISASYNVGPNTANGGGSTNKKCSISEMWLE